MTPKDKFTEKYIKMRVNCNKHFNPDNPEHVEHMQLWWSQLKDKDIEIVCKAFDSLQETYTALVLPRIGHIMDAYKDYNRKLYKPLPESKPIIDHEKNKKLGEETLEAITKMLEG